MCAASPGSRLVPRSQSHLSVNVVGDQETGHALATFLGVIKTSYGPRGRLKAIHNNSGGHVTLTSTASRMMPALSLSNPVLKLIVPAIERHVKVHSDGGLFCGLFSLELITMSLSIDIHKHLMTEIYELLAKDCVEYLTGGSCECVEELDIVCMTNMLDLVRSVVGSKPGCCLFGSDLEHVCALVSEAFLKALKTESLGIHPHSPGTIQYLCMEGLPVLESHVVEGIMFETPQIPTYLSKPLQIKLCEESSKAGMVKIALFNISLAGNSDDFPDVNYEVECEVKAEDAVVSQMLHCAEVMVNSEVGLVGCQRVVHPSIKKFLRAHGVLVLDRLSNRYIYAAQQVTGCQMLGTFLEVPRGECYGWLDSVSHKVLQGRSYLHLERRGRSVVTLVLGNQSEEALEEMKAACISSQNVLESTLRHPKVLTGGGCWQTHLAHHCRTQATARSQDWSSTLECSPTQVVAVADSMASCLEHVALALKQEGKPDMTDRTNHHHWQLCSISASDGATEHETNCCCGKLAGMVDELQLVYLGKDSEFSDGIKPKGVSPVMSGKHGIACSRILDPFEAFLSAFKMAMATACMVLSIHNYIHDKN